MLAAHPPVARQKDGVAFDVAVDDALVVQVGQGSQDRQADGRYLLLVHPETARWKNEVSVNEDGGNGSWSEEERSAPSRPDAASQEIFQATALRGDALVLFPVNKGEVRGEER